jgi:predicted HD phosphohydrolase
MTSNELAGALHERATRGETLTPAEQSALQAWYAEQDQAESAMLAGAQTHDATAVLQNQVDATLAQVARTTQQSKRLVRENRSLRRENARLWRQ